MVKFQPSYGATLSPEAIEGLTSLAVTGISAGSKLATGAIEKKRSAKATKSQQAHDREMAKIEARKAEALAKIEAVSGKNKSKNQSSETPGWVWAAVGLGAVGTVAVGYLALRRRS